MAQPRPLNPPYTNTSFELPGGHTDPHMHTHMFPVSHPAFSRNATFAREPEGDKGVDIDSGTRSQHSSAVQSQRQAWLTRRARDLLREETQAGVTGADATAEGLLETVEGGATSGNGAGENHPGAEERPRGLGLSMEERVDRIELGARLWNATYVPPIEPGRRLELVDKWSGNAARRNSSDRVSLGGGKIKRLSTRFTTAAN